MTDPVSTRPRLGTLVLALALCTPSLTAAQTASFSQPTGAAQAGLLSTPAFARLIEGKQVIVTTADGLRYVGVFTVSGDVMAASGPKLNTTIPLASIARVQKDSFRMRHHTLIGLGVGAAVGTTMIMASCNSNCDGGAWWLFYVGITAGIGAGVGSGVGAILNAIHREDDILYDSRRRTTTMAIAPIVSPTRKGVAFNMTWR